MSGFKILLLGGTGLIGKEVLKSIPLFPEIEKVVVWARTSNLQVQESSIEFQSVTWEDFSSGKVAFPESIDAVICCLGTTINQAGSQEKFKEIDFEYPLLVAQKAKEKDVKAFLIVTAMGANENSKIFYNRVKGGIERELTAIGFPYLGIFRPSILIGERANVRIGEKIGEILGYLIPFGLLGLKNYEPIRAEFVARSMLKTLISKESVLDSKSAHLAEIIENREIAALG